MRAHGILIAGALATFACAAPNALAAPRQFRDCPDCPLMVAVPAGEFLLGSPQDEAGRDEDVRNGDEDDVPGPGGTPVRVRLPPYALGAYEVTHRQFAAFLAASGYAMRSGCWVKLAAERPLQFEPAGGWANKGRRNDPNEPAVCIDWPAAVAYTSWLTQRTGNRYRLPSEAEFEFARRAGSTTRFAFGDELQRICAYANVPDASLRAAIDAAGLRLPDFRTTACDDGYALAAPVGRYKPNAFGLYDMTGNAWEWLADCYRPSYAETPRDGRPFDAPECKARSIRGGSWGYDLPSLRSADRSDDPPDLRFDGIGFRVARDLDP